MSKMSIGTIRRIAEQPCFMLDDTIRLKAQFSKIVSYNAQSLIDQQIIHRGDDATVTITETGRKLLNRKLPHQTVVRALRFAPMKMLGDVSVPGRVRRVTVEQLEHEGYVQIDGATVTLTEKGRLRIVENPISTKTIFHVLRAMPANMVGEKTVPGNIRKDTIHRMMRLGLIQMNGSEISLTPAGEDRLGKRTGMTRLVFSVPGSKVDAVNAAVAGVLKNDRD